MGSPGASAGSAHGPPRVPAAVDALAQWSWRLLLIAAAGIAVVYVLVTLRLLVLPAVAALFLAAALEPPVRWLNRRRLPSLASTWLVLLGAVLLLVAVGALVVPRVTSELDELGAAFGEGIEELRRLAERWFGLSEQDLEGLVDQAANYVRENAQAITGGVLTGAVLLAEVVAGLLLSLVFLFFFLKDGERMSAWALGQVPPPRRDLARAIAGRVWGVLGTYLRGVAIIGLVDASAIAVGLLVIGVPLVLPLAVLTFFSAFFPLVGAVLAGLVAVVVALVAEGPVAALLVLAVVVGVQQLEGDVVAPAVLGRAFKLHPLAILASLTAGALVAGIVGAFLAVPLAAAGVAAVEELRRSRPLSAVPGPTQAAEPG